MTGCFVLHIPVLPSHMSILTFEGTARTFGIKLPQVSLFWRGPRALLASNCRRSPFFGGDCAHFWHQTAAGLPFLEGTARTFGMKLLQVSWFQRGLMGFSMNLCPLFSFRTYSRRCRETQERLSFRIGP